MLDPGESPAAAGSAQGGAMNPGGLDRLAACAVGAGAVSAVGDTCIGFFECVRAEHGLHEAAWGRGHVRTALALARTLATVERPVAIPLIPVSLAQQARRHRRRPPAGHGGPAHPGQRLPTFAQCAIAADGVAPGSTGTVCAGPADGGRRPLADGLVRRWVKSREFFEASP